jgi:ferredoxin--NADP+ reductase
MFELRDSRMVVPNIHLLTFVAPTIAREAKPGQFVIVRAEEEGERIPLSLADWDAEQGTVTISVMNVGNTTNRLVSRTAGEHIPTLVGPLGNPTAIDHYGTVVCAGGCYGIGSIFPVARALQQAGNRVITILEARSRYLVYWEDRFSQVSHRVVVITRDGTRGYRGHIGLLPQILSALDERVDRLILNGCTFLMMRGSATSRPLGIPTVVSLNPIMIDGTGMCGVCRVTVGGATRFACVHGPDFDGHQVDWSELLQRRKSYLREEVVSLRSSRCEEHAVHLGS